MRKPLLVIFSLLGGHSPAEQKPAPPALNTIAAVKPNPAVLRLHRVPKLAVTGDFDGDHRPDTIYRHLFSRRTNAELTSCPDPFQNNWDAVAQWFHAQQVDVRLTLGRPARATLLLGTGQGLYCLLNVGDTNADGKDEIAYVVDYCDDSRVNSCHLATFCGHTLTKLMQFNINEDAFDFDTDTMPTFTEIAGFLVKNKGQWLYTDRLPTEADAPDAENQFKKLQLPLCQ